MIKADDGHNPCSILDAVAHGGSPQDRAASLHFGLIFIALTLKFISIILLILMMSPSFGSKNFGLDD